MKKGARNQQAQAGAKNFLQQMFGGKDLTEMIEENKPASAREIAMELKNILKEEQEIEESGLNIKALAKAVAKELKGQE